MTEHTEGPHAGGFLVSELPGTQSREQITLAAGQGELVAGQVITQRADGKYVAYDNSQSAAAAGTAEGILFDNADTSLGEDVEAVAIVRGAEVNEAELDWGSNNTAGVTAGTADLLARGILLR